LSKNTYISNKPFIVLSASKVSSRYPRRTVSIWVVRVEGSKGQVPEKKNVEETNVLMVRAKAYVGLMEKFRPPKLKATDALVLQGTVNDP
jgi:hypothetical protein